MNTNPSDESRDLMQRLDKALPPHSSRTHSSDGDPMVEAAQRLAQGPDIKLPEAALDRIEAQLRARTQELSAARPAPAAPRKTRRFRWGHVMRYALVASMVLVMITFSVTRASANSLPGDSLYPVKRAAEDAHLALTTVNGEPSLRVKFAERRVDEFEQLLDQDEVHPDSLEEANAQLSRVLDLLTRGYGDWFDLEPSIINIVENQDKLIMRAMPMASVEQQARLRNIAEENKLLMEGVLVPSPGTTDGVPAHAPRAAAFPLMVAYRHP